MSALSPGGPAFLSGFAMKSLRQDQRQTPVAAEKQRRVTHLHALPVAGDGFDSMRLISETAIDCGYNIQRPAARSNEMENQVCRRDEPPLLSTRPKRKWICLVDEVGRRAERCHDRAVATGLTTMLRNDALAS
jgi:hypothetical protein